MKQKQLRPEIIDRFLTALNDFNPDIVWMSYLYSCELLEHIPAGMPVVIDTHNNDWEWFGNFKRSTSNPLIRRIYDHSLAMTDAWMERLPAQVILTHVSEDDAQAYQAARPDLRHVIVPNGCDIKPRATHPDYPPEWARLLFVGSLSSQMNVDALAHFAERFWPVLCDQAELTVLGSRPGKRVKELCEAQGWSLLADADDATLQQAYADAHFALLPFAYGAGSKLKLAEACGRKVPVLATSHGAVGITHPPANVLVSDDPAVWQQTIAQYALTDTVLQEADAYARRFSWRRIAGDFLDRLEGLSAVEVSERSPVGDTKDRRLRSILVHDFGGYPFILEASRELARLGYPTEHHYVSVTGQARDHLERYADPENGLRVRSHPMSEDYPDVKYSLVKRFQREYAYGRRIAQEIKAARPDVVLSANTPSHIQGQIARAAPEVNAEFIPWVQDFYSLAVAGHLERRLPVVGGLLGNLYQHWERSILKSSDRIAVISDDFHPFLEAWGVDHDRLQIIENWGSLEAIPQRPRDNAWARKHGLEDNFCFLYAGTMGLKHNPQILDELEQHFEYYLEVRIVVVGEGAGVDYLRDQNINSLMCLPFQSAEDYPDVLATGDVLTALLEPDASNFSVPSKVLSYLCAGRPLLLAVPEGNLAARIVHRAKAGRVADPQRIADFLKSAEWFYQNQDRLEAQGQRARTYAEKHFRPEVIGKRFEKLVTGGS